MNWYEKCETPSYNVALYEIEAGQGQAFVSGVVPEPIVMVFGGYDAHDVNRGDTILWDGHSFTGIATVHSPSARRAMGMCFDAARGKVVLFGGFAGLTRFGDTWTYDPLTRDWTQLFPAHSPSARGGMGMAYDSVRGKVVLFGGFTTVGLNDTWEWNGTDWTQVTTAHAPSARGDGVPMAWDPISSKIIQFGGGLANNGDTWSYDGSDWTQLFPAHSPSARRYAPFGALSGQGALLFGGFTNTGPTNLTDTWLWNGTDWIQQFPVNSPTGSAFMLSCALSESPSTVIGTSQPLFIWDGLAWDWTPPPVVVTGAATGNVCSTATLNGTITTNEDIVVFKFQWGTTTSYGSQVIVSSFGPSPTPRAVSAAISGLTPGVTYHFRAVATITGIDACEIFGADATFVEGACASNQPQLNGYFDLGGT